MNAGQQLAKERWKKPQAKEKQSKVMSRAIKDYWAKLSPEEKKKRIDKLQEGRKKAMQALANNNQIEKYN